jgi:hypothetical protein
MEQRSLHPIAEPARRNSSGSCQREQKNRRNKNEEPLSTYHNENIIFGDCDSGADTSRDSTKYCLPHGSDQQCAHVRTAAPLNFSLLCANPERDCLSRRTVFPPCQMLELGKRRRKADALPLVSTCGLSPTAFGEYMFPRYCSGNGRRKRRRSRGSPLGT